MSISERHPPFQDCLTQKIDANKAGYYTFVIQVCQVDPVTYALYGTWHQYALYSANISA